MMRYNEWQTDPLSLGDACNSVSARCDLNPPAKNPFTFGGIDCKVKLQLSCVTNARSQTTQWFLISRA